MFRFSVAIFCLLFIAFPRTTHSQGSSSKVPATQARENLREITDAEFNLALRDYIIQQFSGYAERQVPQERFLITLMGLINREMGRRLENPRKARQAYFDELQQMGLKLEKMKMRLKTAGSADLEDFINNLQTRIKKTIDDGEIAIRKKKVFEDALQLLYVAEEMIQKDESRSPQASKIKQKISRSREKLLGTFEETGDTSPLNLGHRPGIYDLYREWQKGDIARFEARLADVRLARQNLLKSSGQEGVLRMFNDELGAAYRSFNYGQYETTDLLFSDLVETYPQWGIKNLDDLYFYWGETNFALDRLQRASELYHTLIRKFPDTSYLTSALGRLVQLNYDLEKFDQVIQAGEQYVNLASLKDASAGDNFFLLGMAYYEKGNYGKAVELFRKIPKRHPFHVYAQYFWGNSYAAAQKLDEAKQAYLKLTTSHSTPPAIFARASYKLGAIEYQNKNYQAAINYFNQVPQDFAQYDKVLNALSWAYFERERHKAEGAYRDFSLAASYAQKLLDTYYASPYTMEARGLLGYINQITNQPLEAIQHYRDVYQVKTRKAQVSEYLKEREKLRALYDENKNLKSLAFERNNQEAYLKAQRIEEKLQAQMDELDLSEISSAGVAANTELNGLLDQIKELDRLKVEAQDQKNEAAVKRIDSLRVHLVAFLDHFPLKLIEQDKYFNYFDDYPVGRAVAENEMMTEEVHGRRKEIAGELAAIEADLAKLESAISSAKSANKYGLVAQLERKREELQDLKNQYDYLLSLAYQTGVKGGSYPEFNKWADFGAFGIINVHFDQKQRVENSMRELAGTLEKVNERISKRKQVIENKIKRIKAEIRLMTMKARQEERKRFQAEREREFRENYFDTRTSEDDQ